MTTDKQVSGISFDPEVLFQADTYIAEQQREGKRTSRSALVNTALLFYLQHVRETEARKELAHA